MAAAEKRYRGIYILTVILGFIAAIFMARFSFCLRKVIDVVIDPTDSLQTTMLSCIYMAVCWLIVSFLYNYTEIIYVNKIVHSLKTNLYKALYQKELKTFFAEKNGHYLSLYSKDIDLVVDNYLMPKCDIVSNILSAAVCLLSIFVINWKLRLSFVIISFITVVLSQIPGTIMARKTVEYTHSNSLYMALLENYLKGFEQVKLLGLGKLFREKLNAKDCAYEKSRMHYLFAKIASNNIGMAIGMLSQLLCMAVGIWFVLHEDMTVGLLIAAVQLLNGVFSPLQLFVQEKKLMGTTKEIIRRIDQEQTIEENLEKEVIGEVQKIEFQDVNLQLIDKPYATYTLNSTVISGICVKCPKCSQSGLVTADKTDVYFSCTNCGYSKMRHRTTFRCQVENQCEQCGRYYRVSILDQNKQNFSVLDVACPFCGFVMQGKVQKITSCIYTNDIKNGCEPFMGLELWFLTNFKGKPVWALNRAHLAYLIEYLSADLREKPFDPNTMRTQADQLPAFMKSAKNREGIIKCLKRMYSY